MSYQFQGNPSWCLATPFKELLPDWNSSHNQFVKYLNVSLHTNNRHRYDNLDATATQCKCVQSQNLIYYASSCHVSERGTFPRTGTAFGSLEKHVKHAGERKINVWLNRVAGKRADFFVWNIPKLKQDVCRTPHPPTYPIPPPCSPKSTLSRAKWPSLRCALHQTLTH